jgi:hypothetical protein
VKRISFLGETPKKSRHSSGYDSDSKSSNRTATPPELNKVSPAKQLIPSLTKLAHHTYQLNCKHDGSKLSLDQNCLKSSEWTIDDLCDILVHSKCRYCSEEINFMHQSFKIFYCPQHGLLLHESYIMYFANKKNRDDSDFVTVNISNEDKTNMKSRECPFKIHLNKCSHELCPYANSQVELDLSKFLDENEITIQFLAFHQQQRRGSYFTKIKNKCLFDPSKVLHEIVNNNDLDGLKNFIKFSDDEILKYYNKNNESILHIAVLNMDYDIIQFLLDQYELTKSLKDGQLSFGNYRWFVNHKSNDGCTPFECLLNSNNMIVDENFKNIFNLFSKSDDCEIENAQNICKQKRLIDFEQQLLERSYLDQF